MRCTILSVMTMCAVASALPACGGTTSASTSTGGTVSGTVGSTTFTVESVLATAEKTVIESTCSSSPDGGSSCTNTEGYVVGLIFTNVPRLTCSGLANVAGSNEAFASAELLEVSLASATAIGPGTYSLQPSSQATVLGGGEFITTTSTCGDGGLSLQSTSGTITLTTIDANTIAGSYTVTFGDSGTFTGTFDSANCPIPDGGLQGSGSTATPRCVHAN